MFSNDHFWPFFTQNNVSKVSNWNIFYIFDVFNTKVHNQCDIITLKSLHKENFRVFPEFLVKIHIKDLLEHLTRTLTLCVPRMDAHGVVVFLWIKQHKRKFVWNLRVFFFHSIPFMQLDINVAQKLGQSTIRMCFSLMWDSCKIVCILKWNSQLNHLILSWFYFFAYFVWRWSIVIGS